MTGLNIRTAVFSLVLAASLTSCIRNDIPYPRKLGRITAFEVEGQLGAAVIDSVACKVEVELADTADLSQVRLLRFEVTENTTVTPEFESAVLNLSSPMTLTLATWPGQEYTWRVSASQTIDRYIRVRNQVGQSLVNAAECQALFYVATGSPLDSVEILQMKLGPSNSVITPETAGLFDFTMPRQFTVSYRDREEVWTVAAYHMDATVETAQADAWARQAYLYGSVPAGDAQSAEVGFRYRLADSQEWLDLGEVSVSPEGEVVGILKGLEPGREYVCKLYCGEDEGEEIHFTTEAAAQMPNMSFDEWVRDNRSWFANPDLQDGYWWDSGNIGANAIGDNNPTAPEESFVAVPGEGKKAVRMETINVIMVMAGGNIFSGQFLEVKGLGARVQFGRPFETRPLTLNGYYSYAPVPINRTRAPFEALEGRMDRCHIFVYVTDWEAPYVVDTQQGIYLDVNDPHVIGYGELIDSVGTDGSYRPFSIDIKYRSHRKPTHCAVVAVASQYADYFTGGIGSLMYADEFSFGYEGDVIWED